MRGKLYQLCLVHNTPWGNIVGPEQIFIYYIYFRYFPCEKRLTETSAQWCEGDIRKSHKTVHTIYQRSTNHSSTSHLSGSTFDLSGIHSTLHHVHKLLRDKKTCEMVVQKSSAPWQAAIRPDDSVCSVIMSQVCRQPPFVPKPPSSSASKDDEWPHYM